MKFKNIRNFRLSVIRRLLKQGFSLQDVKNANLNGANLRYTNLIDADLDGADLYVKIGDGVRIISILIGQQKWRIITCDDMLQIGCRQYPIKDWFEFSDDVINSMDKDALAWWREYKNEIYKKLQELGKI